jgi:hypothetical protein
LAQETSSLHIGPQEIIVPRGVEVIQSVPVRHVLRINPWLVLVLLSLVSIVLAVLDLVTLAANSTIGYDNVRRLFDVNRETSIPTWFSVLQLTIAAMLIGFVALIKRLRQDPFATHWTILGLLMLGLSMDEGAQIHEMGTHVARGAGIGDTWVIFGAIVTAGVAAFFFRFLMALPRATAVLFMLAGTVMISGALGIELIHISINTQDPTFIEGLVPATEEFLERIGIAIMIYALLVYVTEHLGFRDIAVAAPDSPNG